MLAQIVKSFFVNCSPSMIIRHATILFTIVLLLTTILGCTGANQREKWVTEATVPVESTRPVRRPDSSTTRDVPDINGLMTPEQTSTPRISPSPTLVPTGVFVLSYYPPMTVSYNPATWIDVTDYPGRFYETNYLQARELETCQINVQGPTSFGSSPWEVVVLGDIKYEAKTFDNEEAASIVVYYIAYELGFPILAVKASQEEWGECKELAEKVLATLKASR